MKILINIAVICILIGCDNIKNKVTTTIIVKGMTCQGCVNSVQNALIASDGVHAVKVNLEKEKADVTYDRSFTNKIILAKIIAKDAGKVAILNDGKEFIPEAKPGDVCSMRITQINMEDEVIFACGPKLNCINNAKAMYKQKKDDKWEKGIYDGKSVYFCSPMCKIVMDENPGKYLASLTLQSAN